LTRTKPLAFRLTRYFSLTSIVGLILVTGCLIWAYQVVALHLLIEHESRANADLTRAFANTVWRDYRGFVLGSGAKTREALLSDPALPKLRADVLAKMGGLRVAKIKIYNTDGLTVFSTDEKQIGEDKGSNKGFRRARDGMVASNLTYRDHFDAFEGAISARNLIYSYIPVRLAEGAPLEGVFEVYSDVTELIDAQSRARWQIAGIVLASLAALYLFLLIVVRKADRIIARQEQERAAQEAEILHQAHHDALTGLPNRGYFAERLAEVLTVAQGSAETGALLYIDLDRFKLVNDSIGHGGGDQLLKAAADRIRSCLRQTDLIFRMGGDEFTVVLQQISSPDYPAYVARRINSAVASPFSVYGTDVFVGATIGIAVFPTDGRTVDELVRNADAAMYSCKSVGRGAHAFYQVKMNERAAERLSMETALKRAFECGEFQLHYQPRLDAASREIVAVEALLRWDHPIRGLLPPKEFLPVLEEMELMSLVGEWVLRSALLQQQAWQRGGFGEVRVSANVSGRQFQHPRFVEMVARVLRETGIAPRLVELELTESLLILNPDAARSTLDALKKLGVQVSIDDFGTGFSSLDRLRYLPFDYLKIDRSFVAEIGASERDRAMVTAIAALGNALGIKVVVEGVETETQASFFSGIRCGELQGHLFCKALPAAQVGEFFARSNERRATLPQLSLSS
jgi:diguanylate cyclase (GGDEF)-like protein